MDLQYIVKEGPESEVTSSDEELPKIQQSKAIEVVPIEIEGNDKSSSR